MGARHPQAARRNDAASRGRAARGRRRAGPRRLSGNDARQGGRRQPEPRQRADSPVESRRVLECDARPVRHRRGRGGAAAQRRHQRRVRQHRQCVEGVALVPRPIHHGGSRDGEAGRRHPCPRKGDAYDVARRGCRRFAASRRSCGRDGQVPGTVSGRLRDPRGGQRRAVHDRWPHSGHARADASDGWRSHGRHGQRRPQPRGERGRAVWFRARCRRDRLSEHRDGDSRHHGRGRTRCCHASDRDDRRSLRPDRRSRRDAKPQEGLRLPSNFARGSQ